MKTKHQQSCKLVEGFAWFCACPSSRRGTVNGESHGLPCHPNGRCAPYQFL